MFRRRFYHDAEAGVGLEAHTTAGLHPSEQKKSLAGDPGLEASATTPDNYASTRQRYQNRRNRG
jgi:hypothetical protein